MVKVLRIILFIINVLFAAALILSSMAGVLPPSRYMGVSILSYCYFLLLLANILFVLVWLCFSRWEFLLSAGAILLRFTFIPLFFQIGGTADVDRSPDNLKILTFNTHSFKGLDTDTLMTADSGALLFLDIVDEELPDVVCLQEFFSPPHVDLKAQMTARGYEYRYGVHGANTSSTTLLFSRCQMVRGVMMDSVSKFYADIVKNGHKVRVCCVHLDSYQLVDEDREGLKKLTSLKPDSTTSNMLGKFGETVQQHEQECDNELMPLVAKSKAPLVIAGDFNDTPASYIYQRLTDSLRDSYVEQGRGFGTTYHGPFPAFRIDYVLHSPQLTTLAYKRIKTNISDHYPIVVTLQFNE